MLEIKTILCPTDFSAVAIDGVHLAAQICEQFGSRLVLQYNVDGRRTTAKSSQSWPDRLGIVDKEHETRADQMLKKLAGSLPGSFRSEVRLTRGRAHASILDLARELPAHLIVMGTHGRSGLSHALVGSITERVLVQAPCPVLTVRKKGQSAFLADPKITLEPQVVVPIDFSPHSVETLAYAFRMAESLPIMVNLLHVVTPISWDDVRATTHFNVPEFQRQRMLEAREQLCGLIPAYMAPRTYAHVRIGPVVDEIASYAEMINANLILMGLGAKSIFQELLFGATTYGVLRSSPCPVCIVPTRRPEEPASSEREAALSAFSSPEWSVTKLPG